MITPNNVHGVEYATQVTPNKKQAHTLATFVMDRFNEARTHRSSLRCGGLTLDEELRICKLQYDGLWQSDILTIDGQQVHVNIAKAKVRVLSAFLADLLYSTSESPFTLTPTEIPDISEDDRLALAEEMWSDLAHQGFTGGVDGGLMPAFYAMTSEDPKERELAFAVMAKSEALMEHGAKLKLIQFVEKQKESAARSAKKMEALILDQIQEGGLFKKLEQFNHEFTRYPFAVVLGPRAVPHEQFKWSKKGNKLKRTIKLLPTFESGSAFDTWWSPDSTTPQNGTYMLVREQYTRYQLQSFLRLPEHYDVNATTKVLKDLDSTDPKTGAPILPARWTENSKDPQHYVQGAFVDAITYYGKIDGAELAKMGYKDKGKEYNPYILYEIEATLIYDKVVRMFVHSDPFVMLRPVHVTKLYDIGQGMYGDSLMSIMRNLEIQYNNANRWEHNNAYMSSMDVTEVDLSGLSADIVQQLARQNMANGSKDRQGKPIPGAGMQVLRPGTMLPKTRGIGTGDALLTRHPLATPNGMYIQIKNDLSNIIDRETGIPASLHGEAVGSGANRTFRGMNLLQTNSLKGIQDMTRRIDEDILSPVALALYRYNMVYSEESNLKGDCNIVAQGAQGALERELNKQKALDDLNALGGVLNLSGAIEDVTTKATLQVAAKDAILKVLDVLGIDIESAGLEAQSLVAKAQAAQEAQMQREAQMQQQQQAHQANMQGQDAQNQQALQAQRLEAQQPTGAQ